jgi:hypothetical protein
MLVSVRYSAKLFWRVRVDIDLDTWLTVLVDDLEGKVLDITLDVLVVELASDKTLDVVNSVSRV